MKRKISIRNAIIAFLLTTMIFAAGIILGSKASELKYNKFQDMLSDLRMQTLSMELQYNLLSEDPCVVQNTTFLESELSELNSKLDYLENLYGSKDPQIQRLKQQYSILQIQHWMLYKKAKEACKLPYDLVLYFYSNDKCDQCEMQGLTLTSFRKKYGDVKVYAFDKDLKDAAVRTLVDMYKVNTVPTVIYNDEAVRKYTTYDELEKLKLNESN